MHVPYHECKLQKPLLLLNFIFFFLVPLSSLCNCKVPSFDSWPAIGVEQNPVRGVIWVRKKSRTRMLTGVTGLPGYMLREHCQNCSHVGRVVRYASYLVRLLVYGRHECMHACCVGDW